MELIQPPHSIEAEQSLIGALILDNGCFDRISFLQPQHFYRFDHRLAFDGLRELIERGKAADLVLLTEHLKQRGDLEKAGGVAYLAGIAQNTPSSANAVRYAEIVRDKAILRELMQRAAELQAKALAPGVDPRELAEEAEASFLSVLETRQTSEPVHISRAVHEHLDWIDEHPQGIVTGLTDLDALTGGLLPGNLVVIAGRPHMGKTSLALQMAERICVDKPGQMFSLESSRREIAGRLVDWHKHRIGRDAAVDKICKLMLYIDDSATASPSIIRSRVRRMKRQHGCALIVVDYLQLVTGKGDSREQEVSYVSRELKKIAKEFGVPLIALAQLNRKVEDRTDKRPHMSDLRESGGIEADADLILLLYRPDYYDAKCEAPMPEAEIIVSKNRNTGRSGSVRVTFHRELGRFGDLVPDMYRTGTA